MWLQWGHLVNLKYEDSMKIVDSMKLKVAPAIIFVSDDLKLVLGSAKFKC